MMIQEVNVGVLEMWLKEVERRYKPRRKILRLLLFNHPVFASHIPSITHWPLSPSPLAGDTFSTIRPFAGALLQIC